ncbi:sugar-binding domain-containing protein [Saccharicrinis aurantiacus]|uniref:sugar-binding domain-containing protein n=1 Tax=Saccharicrinis aurantiacus TaxID=1849719 RepID=UPI001C9E6849|nr:sugar-binding domain-containing protein [Saccharicrinis aurantiacus]
MMKNILFLITILLLVACSSETKFERNQDFNSGWRFSLNSNQKAKEIDFDDANWRSIELPHDWSIEFPFDTINGEGCVGYLPGGEGWYRKTFDVPKGKQVAIVFDGVYNHSQVWLNGKEIGRHPNGYTPFHYNLTPYLNIDGKNNTIAVKVDRTRFADSRWYPGSGIYRNVELVVTNSLHIPVWGTFVKANKVSRNQAELEISTSIVDADKLSKSFVLQTQIYDDRGVLVESNSENCVVEPKLTHEFSQIIQLTNPKLWGVDSPTLYTAKHQIIVSNKIEDSFETTFGIRDIRFDADKGFFLNGEPMKIKGVCLHHDGGLVGAAVPKDVWRRRLNILKDGGCNAIRISHNPASNEFLDLCDELGFLVQDEFFDEWDYPKDKRLNMNERHNDYITRGSAEYFQTHAEHDLKATVLSHRNHPSIFQWSIGNEIEWTYPRNKKATGFWDADWSGNYFWNPTPLSPSQIKERYNKLDSKEYNIGETAQKLSDWTKEVDTTRPVVANCILPSASYVTGYADALDLIGFSYRRVMYDYGHKYFPNKPLMGTENLGQWHEWKAILERDFVPGMFIWTGVDYMGEAHHRSDNDVRRKGTSSGLLDYAGFKKPSYYMMKSLWSEEPTIFISTQSLDKSLYTVDEKTGDLKDKKKDGWKQRLWVWHKVNKHWNYEHGEPVVVEVISNLPELELVLNGQSLGKRSLNEFEDRIYKWKVPFNAGILEAVGYSNNQKAIGSIITSTEPTNIELSIDKKSMDANSNQVAHVVAQLLDDDGNPVYNNDRVIHFDVSDALKVLGVDNGSNKNFMPYQSNEIMTHQGKALLVVKVQKEIDMATISAYSKRLKSNQLEIQIH